MNREEMIQRTAIAMFARGLTMFDKLVSRKPESHTVGEADIRSMMQVSAEGAWEAATILADAQPKELGGEDGA